jgi:predicted anti-sigma-YlaC factor YlaD
MNQKACQLYEEKLVQYADGELPEAELDSVTDHLKKCPACRQLLHCLQKSMDLTEIVFEQNLASYSELTTSKEPYARQWILSSVAAAILLMIGLCWWTLQNDKESPADITQLEQALDQTARAAKLLTAADLLAKYTDQQDLAQDRYRYIVQAFPTTPYASIAQSKLQP